MIRQRLVKWGLVWLLLIVSAATLSGCGGGVRATNWTVLAVGDGVVYVADLEQVRALDAATGRMIWAYPEDGGGPFYTVTLADGTLFVTSQEKLQGGFFSQPQGVLRALSTANGQPAWPRSFTAARGEYIAPGVVANGVLYIGNGDGKLYALNVADGSLVWDEPFATGARIWATPLVIEDTVYVSSLDHSLYAVDAVTGAERWHFSAGGAIVNPPLVTDDLLIVGSFDQRLHAIRPQDGRPVWEFEGTAWFWGAPASDGDLVYAIDVDGNVYALDVTTGRLVWARDLGVVVRLGPALSDDGRTLIVASNEGPLFGLDASDGVVLWPPIGVDQGGGQIASMVVSGDYVYVTRVLAPERVQAFRVDTGATVWIYPPE